MTLGVIYPALAQSTPETNEDADDFDELLDEVEIDVQGSLDDTDDGLGFRLDGDLRLGYIFDGEDFQDVSVGETDVLRTRWRIRSSWGLLPGLRTRVRVAGLCSTDECDPDNLKPVDIQDIIHVAGEAEPKMIKLFRELIKSL